MTLALHSITARYGDITAVDSIEATASAGRITVVVGPNAAGKSTLLRCAAGLQPCDGEITIDGEPVLDIPIVDRARRVAFMTQRPRSDVPLTVEEMMRLARPVRRQQTAVLDSLLESLEVEDLRHRLVPALSIGQQQRVVLARTLYQVEAQGGLFVFDEPTAPMDPRHAQLALSHLRGVADGGGIVVLSIHDIGLARSIGDDAWLLDRGRLLASGPVEQVLVPERLEGTFGIPYEELQSERGGIWLAPATSRV
tara:strand:- start:1995 stop:2753 length:759 start_codon:yes stop_codon:yes gene_type:complete